jgi:hypothetical protein
MIDWTILLMPLALLAIVVLVPFVGCGKYLPPDDEPPEPAPSPAPTPPSGSGGTPPPSQPPPSPPPTTAAATVLVASLRNDINVIPAQPPNATKDKVESVLVTWALSKSTGLLADPVPEPLHVIIVRAAASTPFIDPTTALRATRFLTKDELTTYDRVTCSCQVTTRPIAGGGPKTSVTAVSSPLTLVTDQQHVFRLEPSWVNATANPREFTLAVLPSAPGIAPLPPTRLQLNPSTDPATHINTLKPAPAPQYKVTQVKVIWTLSKTAGGPVNQSLDETIVRIVGTRPFLEPDGMPADPPAIWDLTPEQLAAYDAITCTCEVTMRPTNLSDPDTDTFTTSPLAFTLKPQTPHVVELLPDWTVVSAKPRRFTLRLQL